VSVIRDDQYTKENGCALNAGEGGWRGALFIFNMAIPPKTSDYVYENERAMVRARDQVTLNAVFRPASASASASLTL
jgi:hypothetical protein